MSATGRGAQREARDFYPTPAEAFWAVRPFLPGPSTPIWEPACGDGRLITWMREAGLQADGSDLALGRNFLTDTTPRACIVTNPPFSLAFEFCQHAVNVAQEVFFLLPLSFLGSGKRKEWFRAHEPARLLVLTERPSFVRNVKCGKHFRVVLPLEGPWPRVCPKCGKRTTMTDTDAMEYAWFNWVAPALWNETPREIFHL